MSPDLAPKHSSNHPNSKIDTEGEEWIDDEDDLGESEEQVEGDNKIDFEGIQLTTQHKETHSYAALDEVENRDCSENLSMNSGNSSKIDPDEEANQKTINAVNNVLWKNQHEPLQSLESSNEPLFMNKACFQSWENATYQATSLSREGTRDGIMDNTQVTHQTNDDSQQHIFIQFNKNK